MKWNLLNLDWDVIPSERENGSTRILLRSPRNHGLVWGEFDLGLPEYDWQEDWEEDGRMVACYHSSLPYEQWMAENYD